MAPAFEEFEGRHDRQQRKAGVAADDGPVLGKNPDAADNDHGNQQPFRKIRQLAQVLQAAPAERENDDGANPKRQLAKMRGDRKQEAEADRKHAAAIRYFQGN